MPLRPLTSLELGAALHRLGFEVRLTSKTFIAMERDGHVVYIPRHRVLDERELRARATMGCVTLEELEGAIAEHRISGEVGIELPEQGESGNRQKQ